MAARTDPGRGFWEEGHTFRVSVQGVSRSKVNTFSSYTTIPETAHDPVFLYINSATDERGAMNKNGVKTVKLSLQQAVEARRFVRRRGSHIFQTIGSQMAMRLSALRAGRPLPPRKIPGTDFR
jgi:hypothetical protein